MKKFIFTIALTAMFSIGITAQTKKDAILDMPYKSNKETYKSPTPSSARPVYNVLTYLESHGCNYKRSSNSHHKN